MNAEQVAAGLRAGFPELYPEGDEKTFPAELRAQLAAQRSDLSNRLGRALQAAEDVTDGGDPELTEVVIHMPGAAVLTSSLAVASYLDTAGNPRYSIGQGEAASASTQIGLMHMAIHDILHANQRLGG